MRGTTEGTAAARHDKSNPWKTVAPRLEVNANSHHDAKRVTAPTTYKSAPRGAERIRYTLLAITIVAWAYIEAENVNAEVR
ncbi:MAG: hypothetical protein K0U93_15855 [Gammaproteobacteria bacterium]|nr:hypothetical protein [Gammaproteobacteria bacterium]